MKNMNDVFLVYFLVAAMLGHVFDMRSIQTEHPQRPSQVLPVARIAWHNSTQEAPSPEANFWEYCERHSYSFLLHLRNYVDNYQNDLPRVCSVAYLYNPVRQKYVVIFGEYHDDPTRSQTYSGATVGFFERLFHALFETSIEFMIEDAKDDTGAEAKDELNLLRQFARPCMHVRRRQKGQAHCKVFSNVHFSWLDIQRGKDHKFGEFVFSRYGKQGWLSDYLARLKVTIPHDERALHELLLDTSPNKSWHESWHDLFHNKALEGHTNHALQDQCAKSQVDMTLASELFDDWMRKIKEIEQDRDPLELYAEQAQRFSHDMYAACRIFRFPKDQEANRPRQNYILYVGVWHLVQEVLLLKRLGFVAYVGPVHSFAKCGDLLNLCYDPIHPPSARSVH